jgi:ATP-binding cassette subfamily F protein 3
MSPKNTNLGTRITRPSEIDRKGQRRIEAEQRQARSRKRQEIQKRIAALEKEIAELETREKELTAELEKPETYATGGRATQINRELMHVHERLAEANVEWEKAGTESALFEAEVTAP